MSTKWYLIFVIYLSSSAAELYKLPNRSFACFFFLNWTIFSLLICNSFKYSGILLAVTYTFIRGFPGSSVVKKLPAMQGTQETWDGSLGQEDPLEMGMATTPVFLPGEFHGPRSLVGYSPQGRKGLDMTDL